MHTFDSSVLKNITIPASASHKGQNGRLLLIGGSHLFHAASLWALTIASRIVDMVFYASVPENNSIVQEAKSEFRNGIVIRREDIRDYAQEANAILLGPGMVRAYKSKVKDQTSKTQFKNMKEISALEDEGLQTYWLTKYMLQGYSDKKWVIDAGALQMMEPEWLRAVAGNVILTPHQKEFETLFGKKPTPENAIHMAKTYGCIIVLKGKEDLVCSPEESVVIHGGNAGMTKGGTGDVLAGLIASLACTNDLFLAACAGSYLNKKASEHLFERMGLYYNASDLALEIPSVMKQELL